MGPLPMAALAGLESAVAEHSAGIAALQGRVRVRVCERAQVPAGIGIAPGSGKAGGKAGFRMGW